MELKNTTLDDLSSVIGFSATMRLAAWFGDRGNVWVPLNCEDGQLLVKLIGMPAAKRLTQEWGNQHINIPRIRQYEDDLTKREIGRWLAHGMSPREIANIKRMSERRVQQIGRELEVAGLIEIVAPKNAGKSAQENEGGKNPQEKAAQELPPAFFEQARLAREAKKPRKQKRVKGRAPKAKVQVDSAKPAAPAQPTSAVMQVLELKAAGSVTYTAAPECDDLFGM